MNRPQLVLFAIAAVFGTAGVVFASSHRRRAVAFATVILLSAIAASVPAFAAFSSAPGGHSAPAPPITVGAASLPTPSLASPACTYTGQTTLHVDWTALAATYSWAAGFQLKRSTNGGAYSDYGSQVTPYSATSATDSSVTSPGSNTYTYKVHSQAGTNWNSSDSGVANSATCVDHISQHIPATGTAQISQTDAMAVDSSGDVAIAAAGLNRVYFIPATAGTYFGVSMTAGFMYLIAGTGTAGAIGDVSAGGGGSYLGTLARVNGPEAIAIDNSANVYVADTGSQDIRVISSAGCTCFGQTLTAGQIDRVAGTQSSAGNTGDTLVGGARGATLQGPRGLALDSHNNLVISDTGNHRLRVVPATTNTFFGISMTANRIYNIAGNSGGISGNVDGTPATNGFFTSPQQIGLDASDNIWIADQGNRTVRKITNSTMASSRFAGTTGSPGSSGDGGLATSAQLSASEQGVTVDSSGNVYIADGANAVIRMVAAATCNTPPCAMGLSATTAGYIYSVVGTGSSGYSGEGFPDLNSKLNAPSGVFFDRTGGVLYIADTGNYMVRKVSPSNRLYNVAGTGTSGNTVNVLAGGPAVVQPAGAAVDSSGNVYFADKGDNRIREYIAATGEIATVAGTGVGSYSGDSGSALLAKVNAPEGVAVDATGNVYIADTGNNRIRVINAVASGSVLGVSFAASAGLIDTIAGGSTTAGTCAAGTNSLAVGCKLTSPKGVDVDSAGDVFIVDTGNNQITFVPNVTTYSGNATSYNNGSATRYAMYPVLTGLGAPVDIAVDSSRNVYIADTTNNRIKKEDITGPASVTTVGGNGSAGHCSSGASATGACANSPSAIVVDGSTVYFVNVSGAYVEKISGGLVTTIAGTGTAGESGDGGGGIGSQVTCGGLAERTGGDVFCTGGTTTNIQLRKIIGPI